MYGYVWVCKSGQVENLKNLKVEKRNRKSWKIVKKSGILEKYKIEGSVLVTTSQDPPLKSVQNSNFAERAI